MTKLISASALLFLGLTLSGCLVTEGRYLQKVSETDSMLQEQIALKKRYDTLVAESNALKLSIDRMSVELAAVSQETLLLKELAARHAVERKDLEMDLKASPGESLQRIAELAQQIDELETVEQKQKEALSSIQQSAVLQQNTDENLVRNTSALYEQILDNMKSEIAAGMVRLSELKGRISFVIPAAALFVSGGVELKKEGDALLSKVAAAIKADKGIMVVVEGHTDNVPARAEFTARYPANWELSAIRAVNVVRQLQSQGVVPQSLAAVAYSEYRPTTSNEKNEGRSKNERIEIHLEPKNL